MNNNKYTMKYIEENKLKKNNENELLNKNNSSPNNINCNKKYSYRNSSNINKQNNSTKNEKSDKYKNDKNGSMKKNNNIKFTIKDKEKPKDNNNNNIHEYKINNVSSSYNNNYTNIKTNKIVFIDLKDNNNNFLKNGLPNDNKNENNKFSPMTPNINQNRNPEEDINDNNFSKNNSINLRSSKNNMKNNSNNNNVNNVNNVNNINNKLNTVNKKNNIVEDKNKLRCSKIKNINNNNNNINKNKFLNLTIQKLDKNNSDNNNKFTILEDKDKNKSKSNKIREVKGLSFRENSYYILSKSPVLRLCERMIFSRSTLGLRYILPKEIIIDDHYIILQNKIDELSKKIDLCDKILNTPFTASKTADITLNFITSFQEIEFKEYPILLSNDEEKKYYLNFLKILYNLLEEEIEINTSGNSVTDQNIMIINLRKDLYTKIMNKGFKSLRDYLYNVFITKKDYIKEIPKIAEINYLISQVNNLFEIHNSLKICKFMSFTLYLVKEIVKFGNNIKSTVELKIKAKNLIDIINKKLYKFKDKYKK